MAVLRSPNVLLLSAPLPLAVLPLPVVLLVLAGVYGLCGLAAGVLYRFRIFIRL